MREGSKQVSHGGCVSRQLLWWSGAIVASWGTRLFAQHRLLKVQTCLAGKGDPWRCGLFTRIDRAGVDGVDREVNGVRRGGELD